MKQIDPESIQTILATDCGSTTTKAILIEKRDGEYRLIKRGEAPTTVEAPVEDVTQGVLNAVTELEELAEKEMIDGDNIIKPRESDAKGVDLYVSTSSAGGGLQMMVAGVVKSMSAESASRAALGAGAIVMDTLATNDGLLPHEEIERIRDLRPDMILLSGGIDGGTITHVVKLAEIIGAANPRPRLGLSYHLPVIYAGNVQARGEVEKVLKEKTALDITDNLRPTLESENLMPSRLKIQQLFLEHVMSHAPGYPNLMKLTDVDIMPTPGAVGSLIETVADQQNIDVVGVDIGGATTDVFSVFEQEYLDEKKEKQTKKVFNRSVSANLGMSYSISNVLAEAGWENVMRWVPFDMDEQDLRNRIKNKMIRPTTIPKLLEELVIEQAIAREALRLSFLQHKSLAVGLKGVQQQRTISDMFDQSASGATLVNMMTLDLIIGSGGVLSHAPRRVQSALMMIDSFAPEGITRLAVDSIFMMPHLGVLASVHPTAAMQVFERDCLIPIGTCIAPVSKRKPKKPEVCLNLKITKADGSAEEHEFKNNELLILPVPEEEKITVEAKPAKRYNLGAGPGMAITRELVGGVVGVIVDTRGRPIEMPEDKDLRIQALQKWYQDLNVYPEALFEKK